ncbi:hypothetical protein DRE_06703 [Drechslerella stenobrocha 248]|uniref:Uncharacterized protein n=1 Tax=Drechslerella stenobrocha 248 TaxID=1043628 RepID=W7HKL5_9PEZI|nr:hypothetical protein DRE_06703 [Drechslerella stenobrocha 248]
MNAYGLKPSLEELEATLFVRPLLAQRREELDKEVSYFERFLKNETSGDIRQCLAISYSDYWHRVKKVVALICTHYTTFHGLDRFKKSSFVDEINLARLIDAIASQHDIRAIIQERENLKSYIRWLIMNHTRGNHALSNKMARTADQQRRSLEMEAAPKTPSTPSTPSRSRPTSRRQSAYSPIDGTFSGYASPRQSRRNSAYIPDNGESFAMYGNGEQYHYQHHQYQYPEDGPYMASGSSRSSFDGAMSPRRQSIKITDILNLNSEGLQEY